MADGTYGDEQTIRDVVTDVINEHVSPRLDQINGRVGKTEARVDAIEARVDAIESGTDERTTLLKSIDQKIDQLSIDVAPWARREGWWQGGKRYAVRGYSVSRRVIVGLGAIAGGLTAILALLGQVPWI